MGEKPKSGKKGHKEDAEGAITCKEAKVKKKQSIDSGMIRDDDNGQAENQQKKRKKDKKDAILDGCHDDRETEKRKKKRKDDNMMSFAKETGVANLHKETAVVEGVDERNVDREKGGTDAIKADNKEKKRKKKNKTKGDVTTDDEHEKMRKKLVKDKKQNVKERGGEVEEGKETNGNKEKKTKCDVTVGDEDGKEKVKEKKQSLKERVDEVEDGEVTNYKKEKEKKVKKSKDKKAEDDITAGDNEQKKKAKEKKEEGRQDSGKKKKLDANDRGGEAANTEGQSIIKKAKKVTFVDEVNVYPLTDQKTSEKDGLVHGKRYTKEEDEMIKKAVYDYIEANHLGEDGLNMVLQCQKHRKIYDCWEEIAAALPHRPLKSVYRRAHNLFERGDNKWTPEDLELVKKLYDKHGSKYKLIADELGRHRVHVKDALRRLKFADANRGNWSQEEYQTLYELVSKDLKMKIFEDKKSKHGMLRDNIAWDAISTKMGTRLFSSCCMKWYTQLRSPMVAEGNWADADDYRLLISLDELDASCEDEVDWDCLLEHRSGELCRKRWKQMVNHLGEYGTKSFSEQVEVLSNRYFPDMLEVREAWDAKPYVD